MDLRFPIVAVEASEKTAEELCELLFELGASGVEQRDEETHPGELRRLVLAAAAEPGEPSTWPALQFSWRDESGDGASLLPLEDVRRLRAARPGAKLPQVLLVASFETRSDAERAAQALRAEKPSARLTMGELVGDEWRERYKRAFAPFALTERIVVVPPWIERPPPLDPGQQVLVLDPGRAFGTGLHPTTALVTQLLEQHRDELCGARTLDVGTGSGILALVALLHGAAAVVAIDDDPDALEVARHNAQQNSLTERLQVRDTPLARLSGPFDWIVANIELRTLLRMATDLNRCLAPGGTLVLSGVLEPQREALVGAITEAGAPDLVLRSERSRAAGDDTWLCLAFRRRESGDGAAPARPR